MRRDRPSRARTRDEIFALYCTFGEKPQIAQDFLAKIMNVLREATEGLLSHAEVRIINVYFVRFLLLFVVDVLPRERLSARHSSSGCL